MLWVKTWITNSDTNVIGRFYLEYLYKTRTIASRLRLDKGMETGVMSTIHAFLRQHHGNMDPMETVIFGPSTANQVRCLVPIIINITIINYCDYNIHCIYSSGNLQGYLGLELGF